MDFDTNRDEAQAKIALLKEKAEKENQSYQQEMKELNRQLEHDRKLKEFLSIKATERDRLKKEKLLKLELESRARKDKPDNKGTSEAGKNIFLVYFMIN